MNRSRYDRLHAQFLQLLSTRSWRDRSDWNASYFALVKQHEDAMDNKDKDWCKTNPPGKSAQQDQPKDPKKERLSEIDHDAKPKTRLAEYDRPDTEFPRK